MTRKEIGSATFVKLQRKNIIHEKKEYTLKESDKNVNDNA